RQSGRPRASSARPGTGPSAQQAAAGSTAGPGPGDRAGGMTTAALIPAHNEIRTIRPLVEAVLGQVDTVIVVDDGSSDGTGQAIGDLDIRLIRHASPGGKAAALAAGFAAALEAGAIRVVTLD